MDEAATEAVVWSADRGWGLAGGEDGRHYRQCETHQVCRPGLWNIYSSSPLGFPSCWVA